MIIRAVTTGIEIARVTFVEVFAFHGLVVPDFENGDSDEAVGDDCTDEDAGGKDVGRNEVVGENVGGNNWGNEDVGVAKAVAIEPYPALS